MNIINKNNFYLIFRMLVNQLQFAFLVAVVCLLLCYFLQHEQVRAMLKDVPLVGERMDKNHPQHWMFMGLKVMASVLLTLTLVNGGKTDYLSGSKLGTQ